MLRIYVTYQISDYLGIYEYYLKFIDSLSNDSQITEEEFRNNLEFFIKDAKAYLRKEKLKKIQNV